MIIEFVLLNPYQITGTYCDGVVTHRTVVSGKQVATYNEGKILWNGRLYDELLFEPIDEATDSFELLDVTIGINFHWERKEDQRDERNRLTGITKSPRRHFAQLALSN